MSRFLEHQMNCCSEHGSVLTAISTEMIPLLAAKFPIDTAQLGLFGISAGGFFTTWAIFQPNTPFNKYIISSPAMTYGRGEAFRQEADYAKTHKDLAVGVYLAAGSLEATTPEVEVLGETVSGMSRLAGVLASRHYPGLKLSRGRAPSKISACFGRGRCGVSLTVTVR